MLSTETGLTCFVSKIFVLQISLQSSGWPSSRGIYASIL